MKEKLHALIDRLTDWEIQYIYTFVTKLFGEGDRA